MSVQEDWLNSAIGKSFNPDNYYGLQCKDVIDSYCIALFGNWINTIRPGNARFAFDNSNPEYFEKVTNNPNDHSQVPPRGAIVVWNGNAGAGDGHIAVVLSSDLNGFDVVEQNGLWVKYDVNGEVIDIGKPAYKQHYSNYVNIIGWLIPKLKEEEDKMTKEQATELSLYARLGAGATVEEANRSADYDVQHILADPGYAAALCKQIYGANEPFRWKAARYDGVVEEAHTAQRELEAAHKANTALADANSELQLQLSQLEEAAMSQPLPPVTQPEHDTSNPSFDLARYQKTIVALLGGAVTVATAIWGPDNQVLVAVTTALTALGVYALPNKENSK